MVTERMRSTSRHWTPFRAHAPRQLRWRSIQCTHAMTSTAASMASASLTRRGKRLVNAMMAGRPQMTSVRKEIACVACRPRAIPTVFSVTAARHQTAQHAVPRSHCYAPTARVASTAGWAFSQTHMTGARSATLAALRVMRQIAALLAAWSMERPTSILEPALQTAQLAHGPTRCGSVWRVIPRVEHAPGQDRSRAQAAIRMTVQSQPAHLRSSRSSRFPAAAARAALASIAMAGAASRAMLDVRRARVRLQHSAPILPRSRHSRQPTAPMARRCTPESARKSAQTTRTLVRMAHVPSVI